jgi:protease-4
MDKTGMKLQNQSSVNRWVWISLGVVFFLFIVAQIVSFSIDRTQLHLGEKVGIVSIEGAIFSSKKAVKELDEFAERKDIKAIVLRINSPGGSVAPTQEIYEKVKTLRGIKPVIASVGAVAASGGYYTALECEKIVANRGSVIGSIGVILEYPVAVDLLKKIGLRFETVKSGEVKDMGNPTREVTKRDREVFQSVINDLHRQFLNAVVEGRSLDKSIVEPLADGSVFTGEQALHLGLIDILGTFENAIEIAANFANISGKPKVIYPKKERSGLLDYLLGNAKQTASSWFQVTPAYRWQWEK